MQVKINGNDNQIFGQSVQAQDKESGRTGQKSSQKQNKRTIFAGELPMHKDPIVLRRQQAQKKAMKMIQDAWAGDRKADQGIAELRELAEQQRAEAALNQGRIEECEARKENLREGYGVEMDSQEQKDLELLQRKQRLGIVADDSEPREEREKIAANMGVTMLTEEEEARLAQIKDQPLTEYQQKCLEIDKEEQVFEKRAESAEMIATAYSQSATSMKIERLKFHKMVDAQEKADKVMEQAGKEIIGMLTDEAKDHVDETYEEKREEEKEKAEEKEEQEEKIEDIREEKEAIEAQIESVREDRHDAEEARREQERDARDDAELLQSMTEAGIDGSGMGAGVQAEIKDMLHKMKLLEADIKGIEVDEEV